MHRLDLLQNAAHVITQCAHAAIVITKGVTYYQMRRYYKMPQNTSVLGV